MKSTINIPTKKSTINIPKKKRAKIIIKKSCKTLKEEFKDKKSIDIENSEDQALLRCMSQEDRESVVDYENKYNYLYPILQDKQFNEKRNFRKWLETYNKDKSFIKETNKRRHGNHRPAKIFTSII